MALVRFEPARELESLQSDMNRLFDGFFGPRANGSGARRWLPAMDLVEVEGDLVLRADLPGVKEDDVAIEIRDNVLTISGQRSAEHEDRREGYHRVERAFGSFARSVTLPKGVDADAVTASFDRGVLEVRVPKPEERKPKRVEISTGGRRAEEPKAVETTATESS